MRGGLLEAAAAAQELTLFPQVAPGCAALWGGVQHYLHNRLLLSTLMPLVGLAAPRMARAQSIPPLRQSMPPKREDGYLEGSYLTATWGGRARGWRSMG